jgi:hypothetical protein
MHSSEYTAQIKHRNHSQECTAQDTENIILQNKEITQKRVLRKELSLQNGRHRMEIIEFAAQFTMPTCQVTNAE